MARRWHGMATRGGGKQPATQLPAQFPLLVSGNEGPRIPCNAGRTLLARTHYHGEGHQLDRMP